MSLPVLFSDLTPRRRRRGDVPKRLYKKISPSNPYAKIPFFQAMERMYTRNLAQKLREEVQENVNANAIWLTAFEMLEKKGIHIGISVKELAEARGISTGYAKRMMLKAEQEIYRHYGINISFVENNGVWRLATDVEVARKYAAALKSMKTYVKRIEMYRPMAQELGTASGTLQLPLFDVPKDLKEGNENSAD